MRDLVRAAGQAAAPALVLASGLVLLDRVLAGERARLEALQAQAATLAANVDTLQQALLAVDPRYPRRDGGDAEAPAEGDQAPPGT